MNKSKNDFTFSHWLQCVVNSWTLHASERVKKKLKIQAASAISCAIEIKMWKISNMKCKMCRYWVRLCEGRLRGILFTFFSREVGHDIIMCVMRAILWRIFWFLLMKVSIECNFIKIRLYIESTRSAMWFFRLWSWILKLFTQF